jgi:type IV secretory pathway VirD2 relaxase
MTKRDDELRIRPGRIRDKSFVGQVMRAAKKAGHSGRRFGGGKKRGIYSNFGRGRRAAAALNLRSNARRVVVSARVVRQHGTRFRSAPLSSHISYLRREGVTRDGEDARMFDAASDFADEKDFAERCSDDRHHFRFIVSPEDASHMTDLHAFTRDLMKNAERDLETQLDWIAVDHWNTDNPHIHILVRGRTDDGQDLLISRNYISFGLRARASQLVTLELGIRNPLEVKTALEKDIQADRWTGLDRVLRAAADDGAGIADLRPDMETKDDETRRLLVGRSQKLEQLGLAEQVAPGRWTLKPNMEQALRDLAIRGDAIKTMHRALSRRDLEIDPTNFALHGSAPTEPVLGRLVERGLQDELKGTAYVVIEGIDGRNHHLRFANLDVTSDALPGAIVETRPYIDNRERHRLGLAVRSDLTIEKQITAGGATWLDRCLLDNKAVLATTGFGAEVAAALEKRAQHLIENGFARRQGGEIDYERQLLTKLRKAELEDTISRIAADTGLKHRPAMDGENITGVYRNRVVLASGRFAMIDDGLGFELVPWRPALEQHLGSEVRGRMRGAGIEWNFERKRGLSL